MDRSMVTCMRKLALWNTKTFKPIMTNEELQPIMETLGFVVQSVKPAVDGIVWKEYFYPCGSYQSLSRTPPPNVRLPCHRINGRHRIDGLHLYTYQAFIDGVTSNLNRVDISDLFHIRGIPLDLELDGNKKFRRMDENETLLIYKDGTLDQATYNRYHSNNNNVKDSNNNDIEHGYSIRNNSSNVCVGTMVPLKDIIVWGGTVS